MKQVAKKARDDPVVTFAWEFVNIALATLKYWSPDEQLEQLNKAKKSSLRAETVSTCYNKTYSVMPSDPTIAPD